MVIANLHSATLERLVRGAPESRVVGAAWQEMEIDFDLQFVIHYSTGPLCKDKGNKKYWDGIFPTSKMQGSNLEFLQLPNQTKEKAYQKTEPNKTKTTLKIKPKTKPNEETLITAYNLII